MPVKNESLQAKTLKKLSPNTIRNLPSPLKTEALNEIATEIKKNLLQRTRYNTYRMGELLTTKTIKRQLDRDADGSPVKKYLSYLDEIIKDKTSSIHDMRPSNRNQLENRYLFKNLERDLLVPLYNKIYGLSGVREDPITFRGEMGGKIKKENTRKKKNKKKKSRKKNK